MEMEREKTCSITDLSNLFSKREKWNRNTPFHKKNLEISFVVEKYCIFCVVKF
jgi:hypothetical protein